jgi:sodium/hydrogen exchanger-like protein 6/7
MHNQARKALPYVRSFFLPPIILYAGLSCRKKAFFSNLPTIASLGILGTYTAFAVIAFVLYGFSKIISLTLAAR